jgi:hypothetical protein
LKKKKSSRKNRKKLNRSEEKLHGRGFDFGHWRRFMLIGDAKISELLTESKIVGCAYGLMPVDGYPYLAPNIALIAEKPELISIAFDRFRDWGANEDPDVVGMAIRFNLNGSYQISLGQNVTRTAISRQPNHQFMDQIMMSTSWIKTMDSTQAMVRDIARKAQIDFIPLVLSAATTGKIGETVTRSEVIPLDDIPPIVKHNISVYHEGEENDFFPMFFDGKLKTPNVSRGSRPQQPSPKLIAERRRRTINTVFPVSSHRISKSDLMVAVKDGIGVPYISDTQVVQAAINVSISKKLFDGQAHFPADKEEVLEKVWEYTYSVTERANTACHIDDLDPSEVIHQLKIDMISALQERGVPTWDKRFRVLASMFVRMGYADV